MKNDEENEISSEAFSRKEREIAKLFGIESWVTEETKTGSSDRIERILQRAREHVPTPDGEARIGRILDRIKMKNGLGNSD